MPEKPWIIYGAYGYTGKRIARKAVERGLRPIIAGRNCKKVRTLAEQLNLDYRCFDLQDFEQICMHMDKVGILLNCAGPFIATSVPLVKACMEAKADYLDITGEIEVFEYIHALDEKALKTGTILCPGAGFDVIATDCMAATLKLCMPDAGYLALAFHSRGPLSPGTAKTIMEGFKYKGMIRKNGVIKSVPFACKVREIDYGSGPMTSVTIPWGDVSTAFYSTEIPNIEVYVSVPERWINILKIMGFFRPFITRKLVHKFLKKIIEFQFKGPTSQERKATSVSLWAEIRNNSGRCLQATLTTANGYEVTITGALGIVEKLLAQRPPPGVYTPSQLMGADYISRLPGCGPINIFTIHNH
ncbi:MAG: saccharopine dehydrogenase NADP-binding domain-containing protein [Desulfobacterales bacterium]